jgi:anthranilate synthase component 1
MATPTYSLSLDEFRRYAQSGNLIPLYREILADYETPVSAFAKIDHGPSAYLLESVQGGEKWARYSFLGSGSPILMVEDRGDLLIKEGKRTRRITCKGAPLDRLREFMETYRPVTVPGLPRFVGGAVGYLGYDMVSTFENISVRRESLNLPEFKPTNAVDFRQYRRRLKQRHAHVVSQSERAIRKAYRQANVVSNV